MYKKIISLFVAFVMVLTAVPMGAINVLADTEYSIVCTGCQATVDGTYQAETAPEGASVKLLPQAEEGKYCKGYQTEETDVTISDEYTFTMPAHSVHIAALFDTKTEKTFDLSSGSAVVTAAEFNELCKQFKKLDDGTLDVNDDGVGDISYSNSMIYPTQSVLDSNLKMLGESIGSPYSPYSKITFVFKPESVEKYNVVWQFDDGTEIAHIDGVKKGEVVNYPGVPVKPSTAEYSYTFEGWFPEEGEITADTVYTAIFLPTVRMRTVIWCNYDGTEITRETIPTTEAAEYKGENPVRESDSKYDYKFIGWDTDKNLTTGDMVCTAVYSAIPRTRTVIWRNYDGTELTRETIPATDEILYKGKTPVRKSDSKYNYTFDGWSSTINRTTGDTVCTAQFKKSQIPISLTAAAKKTYTASAKTKKFTATIKINKKVAKGKTLKLTVNKRTYTATTNSKGVATFKLKLNKKGTYPYTLSYKGNPKNVTKKGKIVIKK